MKTIIINPDKFVPRLERREERRARPWRERRCRLTPQRQIALDILREALETSDPDYVADAAGFWFERLAQARRAA